MNIQEGGTVMKLELNDKEKDTLVTTLENFIPELRAEIASGVKHEWKIELKDKETVLKSILERLKATN
jgi:hypothetical protein